MASDGTFRLQQRKIQFTNQAGIFPHRNVQVHKHNKENGSKRRGLSWDLHVRSKNSCRAAMFSEIPNHLDGNDPPTPEHNVEWFALFLTLKKKKCNMPATSGASVKSISWNAVSTQTSSLWSHCSVPPTRWAITKMVDVQQEPTYTGVMNAHTFPFQIPFV